MSQQERADRVEQLILGLAAQVKIGELVIEEAISKAFNAGLDEAKSMYEKAFNVQPVREQP